MEAKTLNAALSCAARDGARDPQVVSHSPSPVRPVCLRGIGRFVRDRRSAHHSAIVLAADNSCVHHAWGPLRVFLIKRERVSSWNEGQLPGRGGLVACRQITNGTRVSIKMRDSVNEEQTKKSKTEYHTLP